MKETFSRSKIHNISLLPSRMIIFIFLITLNSCSNDDSETIPVSNDTSENADNNFYNLKIGNEWVYEYTRYNPNSGEYESTTVSDVVTVESVENILGIDYFKIKTVSTGNNDSYPLFPPNGERIEYLRTFDGKLIDETGDVIFDRSDFSERLILDTDALKYFKKTFENEVEIVAVNGSFSCIQQDLYVRNAENNLMPGISSAFYSDNIGLVKATISSVTSEIAQVERVLYSTNFD